MEKKISEKLLKEYWKTEWNIFNINMIDHWSIADERNHTSLLKQKNDVEKQICEELGEEYGEFYRGYYTDRIIKLLEIYFHHGYDNFINAVKMLMEVENEK